jgi:ureidoglycolate lyase
MGALHNFCGQDLGAMPVLPVRQLPVEPATEASLAGLGHRVARFDPMDVAIVPWPTMGRRPLVVGTGIEGGVASDVFLFERRGALQYAENKAVGRRYLTGWLGDPAAVTEDSPAGPLLVTHEANYHPDGGQIFFPRDGVPFVALLAAPGDDVRPEDFRALLFDGTCGIHIDPGVWHQPVFPLADQATFDDAQGRVHACVSVDFVAEFKEYLGFRLP